MGKPTEEQLDNVVKLVGEIEQDWKLVSRQMQEENRRLRDKVIALEALLIDLDQVAVETYQYAYELRRIVRDKIKPFLANLESAP